MYHGGSDPRDLYYRIATGMDGTPMPMYGDALAPADLWALVDYVRTLAAPRRRCGILSSLRPRQEGAEDPAFLR